MKQGKLFIISGPSGAGKTTLVKKLIEVDETLYLSISATTRQSRAGEVDGKDYIFLSQEKFKEKIDSGEFLEYACVHGNYYGTLKSVVSEQLEKGKSVILEIDVQGAHQVKAQLQDACLIFVTISIEELKKRLETRATDSEEIILNRLINSKKEIEEVGYYNYIVENDILDTAFQTLQNIIKNEGGNL